MIAGICVRAPPEYKYHDSVSIVDIVINKFIIVVSLAEIITNVDEVDLITGACPGGGPRGLAPPPRNWKAKKKKKSHQSKYWAISPIFCYFFTASFWAGSPPEKLKSKKKKKAFRLWAPPLANSWTRAWIMFNSISNPIQKSNKNNLDVVQLAASVRVTNSWFRTSLYTTDIYK